MEPVAVQQRVGGEECREQLAQDAFLKIQQTLRFSQNPSFSPQQIAYLEDLLANNLLSIVMFSRNGQECSSCFAVVDGILARIRELRG